ncbi:hypothetical protein ACFY2W_15465 [Streptomyces sp. NPDC001262]|uniref:hypothetical protein n=1 Tax=unclassified Streptomyces TaxID=2593676 RepID=UPI0036B21DFE
MQQPAQTASAPPRTEVPCAGRRPAGADITPDEQLRRAPSGWSAVIAACAGAVAAAWPAIGLLPAGPAEYLVPDTPRNALAAHATLGAVVAVASLAAVVVALAGLARVPGGSALVLTFCGHYCGTVRRAGLVGTNPLHLRHRVDVRLHHWRSDEVQATDREGVPLRYAPEVADVVRHRQLAVLEAKDREAVLNQVAGTVETATARLTRSDAVEWDAYERKNFVRELTLALYADRIAAPVPPVAKADE